MQHERILVQFSIETHFYLNPHSLCCPCSCKCCGPAATATMLSLQLFKFCPDRLSNLLKNSFHISKDIWNVKCSHGNSPVSGINSVVVRVPAHDRIPKESNLEEERSICWVVSVNGHCFQANGNADVLLCWEGMMGRDLLLSWQLQSMERQKECENRMYPDACLQ